MRFKKYTVSTALFTVLAAGSVHANEAATPSPSNQTPSLAAPASPLQQMTATELEKQQARMVQLLGNRILNCKSSNGKAMDIRSTVIADLIWEANGGLRLNAKPPLFMFDSISQVDNAIGGTTVTLSVNEDTQSILSLSVMTSDLIKIKDVLQASPREIAQTRRKTKKVTCIFKG